MKGKLGIIRAQRSDAMIQKENRLRMFVPSKTEKLILVLILTLGFIPKQVRAATVIHGCEYEDAAYMYTGGGGTVGVGISAVRTETARIHGNSVLGKYLGIAQCEDNYKFKIVGKGLQGQFGGRVDAVQLRCYGKGEVVGEYKGAAIKPPFIVTNASVGAFYKKGQVCFLLGFSGWEVFSGMGTVAKLEIAKGRISRSPDYPYSPIFAEGDLDQFEFEY